MSESMTNGELQHSITEAVNLGCAARGPIQEQLNTHVGMLLAIQIKRAKGEEGDQYAVHVTQVCPGEDQRECGPHGPTCFCTKCDEYRKNEPRGEKG